MKPADAVPFRSFLVIQSISRPILLTGEPGSGKTLAAYWIASRLKLSDGNMLEFHVKSDSRAKDRHARANRDPEIDVLSLVRSVSDRRARGAGRECGWITNRKHLGERISGSTVNSPPVGRLASASW